MRAPSSVRRKKRRVGRLPSTSSTPPISTGGPGVDAGTVAVGAPPDWVGVAGEGDEVDTGGVMPTTPQAARLTSRTAAVISLSRLSRAPNVSPFSPSCLQSVRAYHAEHLSKRINPAAAMK